MREFREFGPWVDALLDDWDEEYYRAIFDVYGILQALLKGHKPFRLHYIIVSKDGLDGTEYHLIEEYYGSTLIVSAEQGLREFEAYLATRVHVGANTPEAWDDWSRRAHERCGEDRLWRTD